MLRRSLLAAAAATFALPVLRRPASAAADPGTDRQVLHVLDRLAFGPTAADVEYVKTIGIEKYVAEQLNPDGISEAPELAGRLAGLDTLALNPGQLWAEYGPLRAVDGVKPSPEAQKARRQRANIIAQEARAARLWHALYSRRQLNEVMVDFWYNHFNVFAGKGLDHLWVGAYEAAAIRPYALGRFRDLLGATAHHPAMLFYLDNAQNTAPGFKTPDGRELGLNENYAREIMELHTLGVDGGYSQDDVVALARILTGWSLARPKGPGRDAEGRDATGFMFYPRRHDDGAKHFLGRDIAANGEAEGEAALDMLAKSPATARHIARKLAEYFVADTPPPALVARLATRFEQSDGDIRAVLNELFASAEFRDSAGAKYKSPYRYVLSAARASGTAIVNPRPLLGAMARQGQPLYGCPTPDGYHDSEAAWLSPDATMLRVSFAAALGAGHLKLQTAPAAEGPVIEASAEVPEPVDAGPLEAMLAPALSERTRTAVAAAQPGLRAALILGSPDFMRR
ncbi:MAG TPA: DUF1800 domain-containing protein [Stellaceae bacterium]|jgi:uncharacterized protein (DUF1800 family)|nr:DUF1800 domain-containing protein [Stellaceae bacterium]